MSILINQNVNRRLISIIRLLSLFLLLSCSKSTKIGGEMKILECEVDSAIAQFPDSSLFSKVFNMLFYKDEVYMLDVRRKIIAAFDESFDNFHMIGIPGKATDELKSPFRFYIDKDTLCVWDFGEAIKMYHSGEFIKAIRFSKTQNSRFFIHSNSFYFPVTDAHNKNNIEVFPKAGKGNKTYGGHFIKYNSNMENVLGNDRDLLCDGDSLYYAIPKKSSIIEEYDLRSNKLVSIMDIPDIRENVEKTASNTSRMSNFIIDSYLVGSNLYLLCASSSGEYRINTLVRIALTQREVSGIYRLPGEIYASFCVTPHYIFAFEHKKCRIERIKIP